MVIDLNKCTGCQACSVACQAENNVPNPDPVAAADGRTIHWMRLVTVTEGEYPDVRVRQIPFPCMHCDKPPCIKVCPVKATQISKEGIVGQIFSRCIGCRYCTAACPYTVRYFNWFEPKWPEGMESYQNPDVSVRPKGVVEKCTFCHHRLQEARERASWENRELGQEDYIPACVESCPAQAMYFGDLDNPHSEVSRLRHDWRAFALLEDLGTEPKVIYLREEA
jgi:molybdopterin-containing oxidoreductase family iron-sulfur binding subunit